MKSSTRFLDINGRLTLPAAELRFTFSRAGGPGGQNVNKVNTRVTLWFDVDGSPSLTERQKEKIRRRLAARISRDGILRVDGSRFRTQKANREDVVRRFVALLADAVREKASRRRTRIPKAARERRLQAKKRRSQLKKNRSRGRIGDDR